VEKEDGSGEKEEKKGWRQQLQLSNDGSHSWFQFPFRVLLLIQGVAAGKQSNVYRAASGSAKQEHSRSTELSIGKLRALNETTPRLRFIVRSTIPRTYGAQYHIRI